MENNQIEYSLLNGEEIKIHNITTKDEPFLHDTSSLRSSSLSGAYNRVYLVRATPSPKFLAPLGTSDILKTLGETTN